MSVEREIDTQYHECISDIEALRSKIKALKAQREVSFLSKFNNKYGACLNYQGSEEYELKSTTNQPGATPEEIPKELRPKAHFPIKSPEGTSKGDATFALRGTLKGHSNRVYALRWSRDSSSVVSASKDGTLLVWDMEHTFARKVGIPLRVSWVMTADFSPDGHFVASGGLDNISSVFNIRGQEGMIDSAEPHRELQQHEGYVSCNRFTDNEHMLTASGDSNCILWDIEYQQPLAIYSGHNADVMSIAPNRDSPSIFLSGSCDLRANLWDTRRKSSKACIRSFAGHGSDVNCVAWFRDNKSFGTASNDGCCRLFDVGSYRALNVYGNKLEEPNEVTSLDFSRSGYYLAAAYDDGPTCIVWNTVTADVEHVLPHAAQVSSVQFQPNGNSLVTACWDKNLRVWV